MPVPRETPPPTRAAERAFGPAIGIATAFARMLAGDGVVRGLIGPREVDRLWDRHLVNCAAIAPLIPSAATVCDLGSGAGLPGLVLAIIRPDLDVVALEPMKRRADFLTEAVVGLGLENVTVVRARAEQRHGSISVDVVTARAVAPLDKLARWGVPLCRPGGTVLAMKGNSAARELAGAESTLAALGVVRSRVIEVGGDLVDPPATVVELVSALRRAPVRARVRR